MDARTGIKNAMLEIIQVEKRIFPSSVNFHACIPVRSKSIGDTSCTFERKFSRILFGWLFAPGPFRAKIHSANQAIFQKVFLEIDLGFDIAFMLIEPIDFIVQQVTRLQSYCDANGILERAQHPIFCRGFKSAETISIGVVQCITVAIDALVVEIMLGERKASLKLVGKSIFSFRFEMSSVVSPFALSFAQSKELINLPTVRGQRFRAAHETEELLVSAYDRKAT